MGRMGTGREKRKEMMSHSAAGEEKETADTSSTRSMQVHKSSAASSQRTKVVRVLLITS